MLEWGIEEAQGNVPSLKRRPDRPEGQAAQTSQPETSALTTEERRLAI